MTKLQAALILMGILFIVVFLIDYIFIKRSYLKKLNGKKKSKKKNKVNELIEIAYLVGKFNLDKSKLPLNKLLLGISLINAFIIAIVSICIIIIDIHMLLQLLIGFILLMALIYSIYELLGRFLVKVGYRKNGK